ncbi:MAG: SDR family oxidoreductase [Marinoscillum sp.]
MKTALIFGGTSDIGLALARCLASEGWSLILTGRNLEYLNKIASDLKIRTKVNVQALYLDAVDFHSHKVFYRNLDTKPDLCACVFGYLGNKEVLMNDWREIESIIDINYRGAVSLLNEVAVDFAKRGNGSIIGISSVAGDRGRQSNLMYGSAKAAFTAYLSGLRNRMHQFGVHVMTVKPGFVDTRMTRGLDLPPSLTATPPQVAAAIIKGLKRKQDEIYVLGVWRYIMLVIKIIPEHFFKRLKL